MEARKPRSVPSHRSAVRGLFNRKHHGKYYPWLAYGMKIIFPQMTISTHLIVLWFIPDDQRSGGWALWASLACPLCLFFSAPQASCPSGPIDNSAISGIFSAMLLPSLDALKVHTWSTHNFTHWKGKKFLELLFLWWAGKAALCLFVVRFF